MLSGLGDAARIKAARDQISKDFGVRVAYSSANMRDPRSIEQMVQVAEDELGHVDILVNNAGVHEAAAAVEKLPVEKWDSVIATNLTSYFHAIRTALPPMKKRNWGRIINIASTYGLVASVDKSAYIAAVHGVIGLTKAVALENAKTSVTCNAICPGWVLTRLTEKQIADEAARESISVAEAKASMLADQQPSHEFVTIEQIGALTTFLCSNGAVEMRGVALPLDGGWTAQ